MAYMPDREREQYWREIHMDSVDEGLRRWYEDSMETLPGPDMEDLMMAHRTRNKLATRWKLPTKTITQLFPSEKA